MGGKVRRLLQSSLGGQRRKRIIGHRGLFPGGGEGQGERHRLPPPPAQPQATAGCGDRKWGRSIRKATREESQLGAGTRLAVYRPRKRLPHRGTEAPGAQRLHYAPEEVSRRSDGFSSFPVGRLTAAVTKAPGPTQRPAQPAVTPHLLARPPASRLPGPPSPLLRRLRRRRPPLEASARQPRCRWVWPRPLPALPPGAHLFLRLLLLLLPQPPPPQPPEASLPLQQIHLFRIAPQPGRKTHPLREGAGHKMSTAHPVPSGALVPAGRCRYLQRPSIGRRVP